MNIDETIDEDNEKRSMSLIFNRKITQSNTLEIVHNSHHLMIVMKKVMIAFTTFNVQKINSKKILGRTLDSGLDLEIEKKVIQQMK